MKRLNINQVLVFYDEPHLIELRDGLGHPYLGLLSPDPSYEYFIVPLSENRFKSFLRSELDLRDVFVNAEVPDRYLSEEVFEDYLNVISYESTDIEERFLPDEGFYLPQKAVEDKDYELVLDAMGFGQTMIQLSLRSKHNFSGIPASALGSTVSNFQKLLRNIYKKSIENIDPKLKQEYSDPKNTELMAIYGVSGSFKLVLTPLKGGNSLFGESKIDKALTGFSTILRSHEEEELFNKTLRPYQGHTVGSYKKFLKQVILQQIELEVSWYSLSNNLVIRDVISTEYAGKVYEMLEAKDELSKEIVKISGFLTMVDTERGKWKLQNETSEEGSRGEADPNLLKGLTTDTVFYTFVCEEIIEEENATGREKSKYILIEVENPQNSS